MSLPDRMSGVLLTALGGPEVLRWSETIPRPEPGPGEALVQVLAAGVNPTDINTRTGWYARDSEAGGGWAGAIALPRIQGADLCGRVVALGAGTGGLALGARVICPTNQSEPTPENPRGNRVIGSEYDGAFAGYCVVPVRHLHDVSTAPLTDVELGAMPCAYGTAMNLVARTGVGAGDRVLIAGASGGVGFAALQLALLKGAEVTGQCSPEKAAMLREAGAAVLDRGDEPTAKGFDVVLDLVGGANWKARIAALRPGGRYAVAGAIGGPQVQADLRDIYLGDLTLYGCTWTAPEVFAALVGLINQGAIRPRIGRTYPLSEIGRAQADLESGNIAGKLVLLPEQEAT